MSHCFTNSTVSADFKNNIDGLIEKCNLGKDAKNWTKFYVPLKKKVDNIEHFVKNRDLVKCGDKVYFKLTNKNIHKFATEKQSSAYHSYKAFKGTDLYGGNKKKSKNIKIEPMNVASMIVPVYGGNSKILNKRMK